MSSPDEKSMFRVSETSAFTRLPSASSPNARVHHSALYSFDIFSPTKSSPQEQGLRRPSAVSGHSGSVSGSKSGASGSGQVCRPKPRRNSPLDAVPRQDSSPSSLKGLCLPRGRSAKASMHRKPGDPSPQSSRQPAPCVADSFSPGARPMDIIPPSLGFQDRQDSGLARSSQSEHAHPLDLLPHRRPPLIPTAPRSGAPRAISEFESDRRDTRSEGGTRDPRRQDAALKTRGPSGTTKGASRSKKRPAQAPKTVPAAAAGLSLSPPSAARPAPSDQNSRHSRPNPHTSDPTRSYLLVQMTRTYESRRIARGMLKSEYPHIREDQLLEQFPEDIIGPKLIGLRGTLEKGQWDNKFWRMEWDRMRFGQPPRFTEE